MKEVNIHEAKTHFSRLLRRVAAGEEITIANRGVPVARLVSAKGPKVVRELGIEKGRVKMSEDFDAPLPDEILAGFLGIEKPKKTQAMKYLLDTGIFIWALSEPNRLSRQTRELLTTERQGLFLSAASAWEISVKFALGKLALPEPPSNCVPKWMLEWGIQALDISHFHALRVGGLPLHHQDPFDRLLIVQAQLEDMTLLTADRMFEKYPVKTLWCGA